MLGECAFKQTTSAVSSKWELEGYIDTIAKIIESEKIWADPDMADFDTGEREDISTRYIKKKPATQAK
jgi:methionine synthase II (cobalamin-independent)